MDQKSVDKKHLQRCLDLAKRAEQQGEVPVGALIINNQTNQVVSQAFNLRETLQTPIGHAEIIAIHKACRKLKSWRLTGHSLYSSLEPCVMCSGVIIQSRLDRVIYSATDLKGGGQSLLKIFDFKALNHQPEIEYGLLSEGSKNLLQMFFKNKRKKR